MKTKTDLNVLVKLLALPLLLAVVVSIYVPGLGGGFVIDDRTYFIDNDLLTQLQPWHLPAIFSRSSNYWAELLPVRDFFYVIQYRLFAENPFGYHLVSLLLYLLVVVVAWRLVATICKLDNIEDSYLFPLGFSLCFFALHPVHVESVAYISGQKDLLCALFSFSSIVVALQLLHSPRLESDSRRVLLFIFFYYAAFLSKNLAVATFLVITVWGVFSLIRNRKRWCSFVIGWIVINLPVLLWFLYQLSVAKAVRGGLDAVTTVALGLRLVRGVRILGEHFFLLLWPVKLNFGYPFDPLAGFDVRFWCGLAGILLLLSILVCTRSWNARLGTLLILSCLLPISQIFYDLHNAMIYDRYLFVPVLGAGMLIGEGLARLWRTPSLKRPLLGVAFVIPLLLVLKTIDYIPVYKSDVTVAENAYALFPSWNATSFNLAVSLIETAEFERAHALLESESALSSPAWVSDYLLGWLALEEGRTQEALHYLQRSFWLTTEGGYFPFAGLPLARAYRIKGDEWQALRTLEYVMNSRIYNPLEYYRAKKLRDEILQGV